MRIAGRPVSVDVPPLVIAELSGNHGGSLARAIETVDAVAESGAEAIKLQTYTADTMTLDIDDDRFRIRDARSLWDSRHLYELYEEAHTPWEWHEPIFARAAELGLIAFSSPFDATAVDFLDSLHVPAYKIASFEITDLPLIRAAAATGQPLIISTGMADKDEIAAAVSAAESVGCTQIALLRCTSAYPATASASRLRSIQDLRRWTDREVGLSDHTLGTAVAVAAVALGASIIEKHVTLDHSLPTVDGDFSLDASQLASLVRDTKDAWESLGQVEYGPTDEESGSLRFRRGLYFIRDVEAGSTVTEEDVRSLRPAAELPPEAIASVLGRRVAQRVRRGDAVSLRHLA